ncbi:MAG: potassium channel protein [Elusimicrobiota bacterium]
MDAIPTRLKVAFLALIIIFAVSIAGYMVIEKWNFLDALYMTVISLATVGYGETNPLTIKGRIFTIFILLGGIGMLTFVITSTISFLVEGELKGIMRRRKMEKRIGELKNHCIICAEGETGEYVIDEFYQTKQSFVVITSDQRLIAKAEKLDIPLIVDNPADDNVLHRAGIERATGLVSVLHEDRDNLLVVLSANAIKPELIIVTQTVNKELVPKMKKAGADEVVSTNFIGAMRIASVMIRPEVVSFLDTMLRHTAGGIRVEEAAIGENSPIKGKTIKESGIHEKTGLLVIAVKEKTSGEYKYNIKSSYKISEGDVLIVIGNPDQIKSLDALSL